MLKDYKHYHSTDANNYDWRLYEFTSQTHLPLGYFHRAINVDAVVVGVCIVALFVVMLTLWVVEAK